MVAVPITQGIAALSFLLLYWFALGGLKMFRGLFLFVVGASLAAWFAVALPGNNIGVLELVTRWGIGIPASLIAALAFAFDTSLRAAGHRRPVPVLIAALCFALYGVSQTIPGADNRLPAAIFNAAHFEALVGFPVHALRATIALVLAAAILSILHTFDVLTQSALKDHTQKIDAAFRTSQSKLQRILDSEPHGVATIGRDYRIHEINAAGLNIFGIGAGARFSGVSALDHVAPEYLEKFRHAIDDAFRGLVTDLRFQTIGAQGIRWLDQRASPLPGNEESDAITEVLALTRDVTDIVTAEAALRQTTERLNEAQRIAEIGSWELDLTTSRLVWSDEIYRIFEIDPQGFGATYEAFLNAIHPDDRTSVNLAYTDSLKTRQPYGITHRLLMPDGNIKWVEERCETSFDEGGKPLVSRGTVQDISHKKKVQDALHQSETTLAAFLKTSPEAVIIADQNGRITVFSTGAEVIFGHKAADIVGQPVERLIPDQLRAAHRGHMDGFAASHETGRFMSERAEIAGLRANGEVFPAEASLARMSTPDGLFFAVVLRDVTQQKAVQTELRNARTAAEAASEAKSRFIANMSHELRTPLNAIIGFSDLLTYPSGYKISEPKQREYARDIGTSGRHLLTIINDILDISRIDLGSIELTPEEVPVEDIVQSCVRMVRIRANEAAIVLMVEIEPDLPALQADRRLLTQALLNLLSNAIRFTTAGGHVVTGACRSVNGAVQLFVRDTGIGMKAEQIAHVGEPFLQGDTRLERQFDGSGLGLSITKRLVEMQKGILIIESTPGVGTTATISFHKAAFATPSDQRQLKS